MGPYFPKATINRRKKGQKGATWVVVIAREGEQELLLPKHVEQGSGSFG